MGGVRGCPEPCPAAPFPNYPIVRVRLSPPVIFLRKIKICQKYSAADPDQSGFLNSPPENQMAHFWPLENNSYLMMMLSPGLIKSPL